MTLRLAICLLLCTATVPAASEPGRVWLEVERPYSGWVELGMNPLVEVRGAAGSIGRGVLDLVVILDVSRSTAAGSGADVNRDGHVGGIGWRHRRDLRSFLRHPQRSSDPGDSILHAETEAVRRLLRRLDLTRTRVGIVTLRERAQVRASLGSREGLLLQALDVLETEAPEGRTNYAQAIRVAVDVLHEASPAPRAERELGVILLSDGRPTVPAPDERAAREAVLAAEAAYRQGVRIYTVALGVAESEAVALGNIAAATQGRFVALGEPGDILDALPYLDLRGLANVIVENRTTGKRARALRVWADGSFDGFVELRPGKNQLSFRARGAEGAQMSEERFVYYRQRPPRTARERALETEKLQHLRDFLRERSLEVQLAREGELSREERDMQRSLSVETERD
jgi:hypothetical protein